MPFVAAPGVTQVNLLWALDTERGENTFYYTGLTHPISGEQAFVDSISVEVKATFQTVLPSDVSLIGVYVRDLGTQTGESFELAPTVLWNGTLGGARIPNNVSIAIKRSTGLAGRSQRGRIYYPALTQTDMASDNAVTTGFATAVVNGWNGYKNWMLSSHGATEVILHRAHGTSDPVRNYSLTDLWVDSQRRRLPGHNRHH